MFLQCVSTVIIAYIIISPLNSYLYIHWILDFKLNKHYYYYYYYYYLPVSISNGRIPVLNCDMRERRQRDIHLIIYVSGSNISLNIMYVLSLGVFSIVDFHLVT